MAKRYRVIGYDIDESRLASLVAGRDETGAVEPSTLATCEIQFTADAQALAQAGLVIVAVPTPVDRAKRPDLEALKSASRSVGRHLRRGMIVVYESTVYPGCTEEVCVPILEQESGLIARADFGYGYSPERINPGDRERTVDRIQKVVSGSDAETLAFLAAVYGAAIPVGIYRAPSIRVAEAAKVIENTQRDLNIALMNELSLIFHRLGLDTLEVLEAAGTKWNFMPFRPGLVGGHCIGVDPYYLTHKAQEVGYHPEIILAGRHINDSMGEFVARECIRLVLNADRRVKGASIAILGLSFKENCPDIRNTKVVDIIRVLRDHGAVPMVMDPMADAGEAMREYGITLRGEADIQRCEAVIVAVAHRQFKDMPLESLAAAAGAGAPFLDVKAIFDKSRVEQMGFRYWRL
jgi:UDP-N-acetyl-D-galactosamine dehydrogenase